MKVASDLDKEIQIPRAVLAAEIKIQRARRVEHRLDWFPGFVVFVALASLFAVFVDEARSTGKSYESWVSGVSAILVLAAAVALLVWAAVTYVPVAWSWIKGRWGRRRPGPKDGDDV